MEKARYSGLFRFISNWFERLNLCGDDGFCARAQIASGWHRVFQTTEFRSPKGFVLALDHYVSQVHLANFLPAGKSQLIAYGKKKDRFFPPRTSDVCRLADNSTNPYLSSPRAIEELLRRVEPVYNRSVESCANEEFTPEAIFALAGFVAYIMTCSPAGVRIRQSAVKGVIETTAVALDANGRFDQPPIELAGMNFETMLNNRMIEVSVDPKYPQAVGISMMIEIIQSFGNGVWDFIHNDHQDAQFFSSDYPIVVVNESPNEPCQRIVPLRPNLALCIRVPLSRKRHPVETEISFEKLVFRSRRCGRDEAIKINRDIVRCAEDVVFIPRRTAELEKFLRRNRSYHVDTINQRFPADRGYVTLQRDMIVGRPASG